MSGTPTLLCTAAFAAIAFCAGASFAAQAEQNAAAVAAQMMIDAGRLGVILDQTEAAIKLRAAAPPEEPVETTAQQQVYAVHELRAAVLRYATLQFDACRAGIINGDLCAPYVPDWLKEPLDTVPPVPAMAARVQDTLNHISPFWKAMCARAVAQTHDDTFCAIE